MRMHLPPSLSPAIAAREDALRERDREVEAREVHVGRREQRLAFLQAELRRAAIALRGLEGQVRTRETRLMAVPEYAVPMQRALRQDQTKVEHPPWGQSAKKR